MDFRDVLFDIGQIYQKCDTYWEIESVKNKLVEIVKQKADSAQVRVAIEDALSKNN